MLRLSTLFLVWLGLVACSGSDKDSDEIDGDGDGYTLSEDCDDDDADVSPGGAEICDGKDNDCDDDVDENVSATYWADADGDGYGDPEGETRACSLEEGLVTNDEDCDDSDAAINPDGTESCNEADDDCDDSTDEGVGNTYYTDADGDGYGDDAGETTGCTLEEGFAEVGGDCDDDDELVSPGTDELCDGFDNDCDEDIDENGALDARTWYADDDDDSYGDPTNVVLACDQPSGYVGNDDDCDDTKDDAYPGATEYCDSFDNDCDDDTDESTAADAATYYIDADEDGYGVDTTATDSCEDPGAGWSLNTEDCDDGNADVNPSMSERCDAIDNDCDSNIDEDGATDVVTWYRDSDGDGYGDSATSDIDCEQPSGYVDDDSDCDDAAAGTYPGADEVCDDNDNDCDSTTDEEAIDASTWFVDDDGDGWGDADNSRNACDEPSGFVADDSDCDDADADINPNAVEECDSSDNDCDGDTDEDGAYDATTWYVDDDADGFGDPDSTTTTACEAPSAAWSDDNTDCDDADGTINPDADETCDETDNDCDGTTDEDGATDATTWYLDADEDGYGDSSVSDIDCEQPSGYVDDDSDCDDGDGGAYPSADETCDDVDNDCDGATDEDATDTTTYYADLDEDGYGDASNSYDSCELPTGYTTDDDDCDDTDPDVSPSEVELCDGDDNDCDGDTDEDGADDATTWYVDNDGDNYGDSNGSTQQSCTSPGSGWSDASTDCDDDDADLNPEADEECDGVDNDCDSTTDEDDAIDASTWYVDNDGDGYGGTGTTTACDEPSGYTSDTGDCDDDDLAAYPGGTEYCDGVDNDCDSTTDENATDDATWYVDSDGDGYGDSTSTTEACGQPTGYVRDSSDCDDADFTISPGATETCDGEDDDCDGDTDEDDASDALTWYLDSDEDGYGDDDEATVACDEPSGYVSDDGDCDDDDGDINPDADEVCDDADNDCDADIDEDGATDVVTWYRDSDGDGYGRNNYTIVDCDQPSGYAALGNDCLDSDNTTNPGASETCDGNDDDCDGTTDEDAIDANTYYADTDRDGYGDPDSTTASCSRPSNYANNDSDCNDSDATIKPGGTEYCDDVDEDCDDSIDENAADATTYYADDDGDGYGDPADTTAECELPSGYAENASDCDDSDASRSPDTIWYYDADRDGYGDDSSTRTQCSQPGTNWVLIGDDCEPSLATANPDEEENCFDSIDNDCDGDVDEECPTEHCGTITSDETWSADEEHTVTCDVYVCGSGGPEVTIEDGVTVEFQDNTELYVGTSCGSGSLTVEGTSSGVVFTSDDAGAAAAGDWGALYFGNNDNNSSIDGLTVEYAGSSHAGAIYLYQADIDMTDVVVQYSESSGIYLNASTLLLQDSLITDNTEHGIYLSSNSTLDETGGPTFTNNTLTDNGEYPIVIPADYLDQLDASSTFTGNGDAYIYVHADYVTSDGTWQALDVPYYISGNTFIQGSSKPEVTIEDGASLYFNAATDLYVGYGTYGLLYISAPTSGVLFTSAQSSQSAGDWDGITFGAQDSGSYLEGVTVEYAGGNGLGNVYLYSADITVVDSTFTDSSTAGLYASSAFPYLEGNTFSNNDDDGLYLASNAGLDTSSTPHVVDSTFTGNGGYPLRIPANYLGELDASSTFTGNGEDLVYVHADTVSTDATWQYLDVDYYLSGSFYIQGTSRPQVTVEGGSTFYVNYSTDLYVGTSGYGGITVDGTSTAPVTFTSIRSTPRAGDWDGLYFGAYDLGSSLTYTTVSYAGGNGYGNIRLSSASPTFDTCTVTDSTVHGLHAASSAKPLIVNSTFSDNDNSGVFIATTGGLDTSAPPGFSGNTMVDNGDYPLVVPANFLGELATDNSFSGNTDDIIYVYGDTVDADASWEAHDVPYLFAGSVYIQGSSRPVVTVSEGTELQWEYDTELFVGNGSYGGLIAEGTSADPIVFTSSESTPANGDWRGIRFGPSCEDSNSLLTYAEVSYGGANGYANVYFNQCDGSVEDSEVAYSSNYGIYRYSASPTLTNVTYTSNTAGDLY